MFDINNDLEAIKHYSKITYDLNPFKTLSKLFLATMYIGTYNRYGNTYENALSGYNKLKNVKIIKDIILKNNTELNKKYTHIDVTIDGFDWNNILNKNTNNKRSYVYILLLNSGRIYIGFTRNIIKRLNQHICTSDLVYKYKYSENEISAFWVYKWGIDNILSIYENGDEDLENDLTLKMMLEYNWEHVRGGKYVQDKIKNPFSI